MYTDWAQTRLVIHQICNPHTSRACAHGGFLYGPVGDTDAGKEEKDSYYPLPPPNSFYLLSGTVPQQYHVLAHLEA